MTIRTFNPLQAVQVQSAQGLDVSNYNGQFDWAAAVHEVPDLCFGLYRLTEGLGGPGMVSPDPDAQHNHTEIIKAGIPVRGMYHVLHPDLDGAKQAAYFVETGTAMGHDAGDIWMLDDELGLGQVPASQIAACGQAFMRELTTLMPHAPRIVYTYIDFIKQGCCGGLGGYPLDLAYPAATAPVPPMVWVRWTFWQWGARNGIDADAFNGTREQLLAWVASYAPKPPAPQPRRLFADGKQSLSQLAVAEHTTVQALLWETAHQHPQGFGPLEQAYFGAGEWERVMTAGMSVWAPPA
jgi:GH25 family lysozyme M1 (1,4-beta-N-acetylmuramidase)